MRTDWWGSPVGVAWLRQAREDRGFSQDELAEAIGAPDRRVVSRWERGTCSPSLPYRKRYRSLFGLPPWEQRGNSASDGGYGKLNDMERRKFLAAVAGLGLQPWQLAALVGAVADEAVAHVSRAELSGLGPLTLDGWRADISRLSRAYVSMPARPLFAELVGLQNDLYRGLEDRPRPEEYRELHLMAGQVSGLLANASLDLGHRAAAAQLAESAWRYGEIIGHDPLRAWAQALRSCIASWSGRLDDAADFAEAGLSYSVSGPAKARLYGAWAAALSRLGRHDEAVKALGLAYESMGTGHDEIHALGGEFAYQSARLESAAASTLLGAGSIDGAVSAAERALAEWRSTPDAERSYGSEAIALLTLGKAYIRGGRLDGAAEALRPVLSLPSTLHIELYGQGAKEIKSELAHPRFRGAVEARELGERITSFHTALPAATAG